MFVLFVVFAIALHDVNTPLRVVVVVVVVVVVDDDDSPFVSTTFGFPSFFFKIFFGGMIKRTLCKKHTTSQE